ncbi:MAG: putative transmembrane protein [Solidesulfovibrio magneticus str. Maddingley MBC34]|uniref:Putative transmembrane protein n=1 Tax=Solidesulfovibrio magneticus str. Maddingley MBC34 TaxID=1206767 RepID=K6GFF0_9BACT|nr:MAG: putative transmembrane protein [Solidesulfovibrio magneticus str. Maddingley MBC34]
MKRAILVFLLLVAAPAGVWASGLEFSVAPGAIDIGSTYNGTSLAIDGRVPEGSQVVARVVGAPQNLALKQKGKVFGLLWMNMNTLHFSGVPSVCLIDASAPLQTLGAAGAGLGLTGLTDKIGIEPSNADRSVLLPEFLRLKGHEGLYRETAGGVTLGQVQDGRQAFSLRLPIPSRLSPGSYAVEVYAVKDGAVVAQASRTVEARLTGAPAFLANLAFNHAAWYGVLASVIAILGGLAIGLVFQSKGAH